MCLLRLRHTIMPDGSSIQRGLGLIACLNKGEVGEAIERYKNASAGQYESNITSPNLLSL
jgi:hypothetical protein